jgi:uracil-DNA glycosylase family 4
LGKFRRANRDQYPEFFNAPVPSFGRDDCRLLVVGLAPGLKGANRTGRPFTGDYAGDLLYATLAKFGFCLGEYAATADDGLKLQDAMITNAVRCVPPQNKPTPAEIRTCQSFLSFRIASLKKLRVILALGRIAHDSTVGALGLRHKDFGFGHGNRHEVGPNLVLFDSFHCSRYNTNTRRLTEEMFTDVFRQIRLALDTTR